MQDSEIPVPIVSSWPHAVPARALAVGLCLLALCAGVHGSVPGPSLHFERIGTENGPPADVVTAILQDSAGFIWIGSRDVLALYDGYTFTLFEHNPLDPFSISDNTIRTIYEDSRGFLWVGTNTGGLNRLDRATWQFEHFRHNSADVHTLSHDSVYAILESRDGAIWIGTQLGLNRLDPATGQVQRFRHDPEDSTSLSHDYVYALYEDRDGALWVSTIGGGLNRRDPLTGKFSAFRHDAQDPESLTADDVLAIVENADGNLWVSTSDGLNLLDRVSGKVRRFEHDPAGGPGLSDPLVTSLAVEPSGKLWIGTHGGGLDRLDPITGEFQNWRHDRIRRNSLGSDEVIALMTDASGALWVGTWGGGLNRITASSLLLSESAGRARTPDGLDVEDVTGLLLDRGGALWIGTRTGDVVRRPFDGTPDRKYLEGGSAGSPRIILGFAEEPSGQIWVASSAGIVRLDTVTGKQTTISHDPQDATSLGPGYVKAMHVDRQGQVWVGTGEGGLQQLDAGGQVVRRFRHDPDDAGSLSDDYVTAILEDDQGTLWVGTRSGGVNAVDPHSGAIVRYLPNAGEEGALSHHYVTSIVNAGGELWIGTGGGGLNRLERDDRGVARFVRITESDGLIDDDVMGILEDSDGSLWISTRNGVTRFDSRTGATLNLFAADGLKSGEFEPGAAAQDAQALYFGSVKGLVAIPAGTQFQSQLASPTVLTSIRTSAGPTRRHDLPSNIPELEIPWGEWVSLRFAVLDYRADRGHRYAYRLGGEDRDWIDLGIGEEVTFTDLDPGTYRFSARGRNSQGGWSELNPPLEIRVIPPFWMTNWFRAGMALLLVSLVVVGHRWRISIVARRHSELLDLHRQREKTRAELGVAYGRLRRLTNRLEVATEEERKRIARELHDEMGPTLTAVIINLQLLARAPQGESSDRLEDTIELVDRMVQRVRDLSLDLRPPLLEELGLVPALRGYLESQGQRVSLDIKVNADADGLSLSPETEIASFRVVQEAVTNVIRHADATQVTVNVHRDGGSLDLSVKDNGRGFNVRDTMEGPTAKALGLLGLQERVFTLGGKVEIESEPGCGTEVRVRVPLDERP